MEHYQCAKHGVELWWDREAGRRRFRLTRDGSARCALLTAPGWMRGAGVWRGANQEQCEVTDA